MPFGGMYLYADIATAYISSLLYHAKIARFYATSTNPMIKRLFNLFSQSPSSPGQSKVKLQRVPRDQHGISRRDISPSALKVMNRLNQAGFESYLVGGGVRDLLLGGQPKDFDVATDATPEQINTLFRNARIIGRRFKIVHVRFGREIIEVTTFRGQNTDSNHQIESDTGQLLRDNVYGDLESDAVRRDFTANALYYSSKDLCVYDYTGGITDLGQRQLKMIGDPKTRYTEDPVRLLRAIRFAAKLGFTIEASSQEPIRSLAGLLEHIPAARLFDEILKLFLGGYATATYALMQEYALFTVLFPDTQRALQNDSTGHYRELIDEVMLNTDKRIRSDKRVTPAFIYAALLWPAMHQRFMQLKSKGSSDLEAFNDATQSTIQRQLLRIMIPKRFLIPMRQIWELQWRLPNRNGKRPLRLLEHPKFRAGFDFLLAREAAGEDLDGLGAWWERFQHVDAVKQESMLKELGQQQNKRPRKRRKPQVNSGNTPQS